MRIYEQNLTGTSTAETARTTSTQESGRIADNSANVPRGDGDSVELSGALRDLSRALTGDGGERSVRIQALAEQYEAGNYEADSTHISQSMVSESLLG